ncbi:MAG: hypothetical protein HC827_08900 [Cyanobacteria bacterium RM1_2_2]|nr:hypothetical protein [Cyanobacteria bacterium RM1_2_2]
MTDHMQLQRKTVGQSADTLTSVISSTPVSTPTATPQLAPEPPVQTESATEQTSELSQEPQPSFFNHDFGRLPIFAKLSVSQPNDPYEQEADRVAEQVMRTPDRTPDSSPSVQGFAGHDFGQIALSPQLQPNRDEIPASQQTTEPETAGRKRREESLDSDPRQLPSLTVRSRNSKRRRYGRKENKEHPNASNKTVLVANTARARRAIAEARSAIREVVREDNKKTDGDSENQGQANTRRHKVQRESIETNRVERPLNSGRINRNNSVADPDAKDSGDNDAAKAVKEAQGNNRLNRSQKSVAIQQTADTEVSLARAPVKSMLMTTQEGIDALQPDEIFGPAGNGMVLFQTSNPEQYLSMADQGIDIRQVPDEQADQYRETQRLQVEAAIARFVASGRARIASITSMSRTVRPRIQKAAQQTKVSIQAAIEQNRKTITNKLDQAREQVQEKANSIRGQINTRHSNAIAAIRSSTATARTRLESAYQANIEKLDQLDQSLSSRLDDSLNRGADKFRAKGLEAAGAVDAIANEFKNRFNRESPPEPSNRVTEFLESFDRDTYTENWRNAKKDATDTVAGQYRQGLIDNADQKAEELNDTKDEHLQQLQELVNTTRTNLQTQYTSALQGLNQAEQTAIQTADQALNSQLNSLDQSLNAALDGLRQAKTDQLSQLNRSAKQQQAGVDIKANSVITTLQERINQGAAGVEEALQEFAAQAQRVESPNLITIQSVTAEAQVQLNQAIATTRSELDTSLKNSEQGLTQEGQQVVDRLNQIGQQAESRAKTNVQEFSTSAAQVEQAATQAFTQMQSGHARMMQSRADQSVSGLDKLATDLSSQVDGFFTNFDAELETSAEALKTGLVDSLEGDSDNQELRQEKGKKQKTDGIRPTIEEEARIAAEQVQPAWKEIAKVVIDIVITVAVVVAIAALAASGVGMVAVVLLAAAIGAAGEVLKLAANDAIDGQGSPWEEYAKQAGIGAASGILQAVGLRGGDKLAGAITNQFGRRAAQAGVEAATDTVIDVGTQVANGEDFSLRMLATSAGLSLLGSAGGEVLSGSFGRLGQRVGRSDAGQRAVNDAGQRTASDAGQGAASNAGQRAVAEGGEFVAEVTVDTGVGVADQMLQGEDFSAGMLAASAGEAALGSVVGRGADRLYGDQLRGLGQDRGDAEGGTSSPDPSQPDVDVNVDTPQVPDVPVDRPPGDLTPPTPEVADTPAARRTEDTPEPVTPDSSSTRPARETSEPTQTPDGTRNQPDRTPDPTRDRSPEKPAELTPDTTNRPLRDPSEQSQTSDPNKRPIDQTPRQPEEGGDRPLTEPTQDPRLLDGLPPDLRDQIPIHVDPTLTGNTVRVHYTRENGVITNIHMRVGPNATQRDIELHVQTARMMQRYSGFSGRIRMLKERIQNWVSRNGEPPVGSRAWEAQLEIDKLPRIIDDRLEQLSRGDLDPATEAALQADIENLEQQLARHQQTLDEMDTDPGVGFVAAESRHKEDFKKDVPEEIFERSKDLPEEVTDWDTFFNHFYVSKQPNGTFTISRKNGDDGTSYRFGYDPSHPGDLTKAKIVPSGGGKRPFDKTAKLSSDFTLGEASSQPNSRTGNHEITVEHSDISEAEEVLRKTAEERAEFRDEKVKVKQNSQGIYQGKEYDSVEDIPEWQQAKDANDNEWRKEIEKEFKIEYDGKTYDRLEDVPDWKKAHDAMCRASEQLGEQAIDAAMAAIHPKAKPIEHYELPGGAKTGQFDRIYQDDDGNVYVIEGKGAGATRGGRETTEGLYVEQGTPEYLDDVISNMGKAAVNTGDKELFSTYIKLRRARREGNSGVLHYLQISQRVNTKTDKLIPHIEIIRFEI